jgi:hypothetical protein
LLDGNRERFYCASKKRAQARPKIAPTKSLERSRKWHSDWLAAQVNVDLCLSAQQKFSPAGVHSMDSTMRILRYLQFSEKWTGVNAISCSTIASASCFLNELSVALRRSFRAR